MFKPVLAQHAGIGVSGAAENHVQTRQLVASLVHARCRHAAFSGRRRSRPSRQHLLRRVAAAGGEEVKLVAAQEVRTTLVQVEVEQGPRNSRRLYAGIDIAAPLDLVWNTLTDYDGLAEFIPGLAENKCLARWPSGARLLQIGEQALGLGAKFKARVVLDIEEHPSGLSAQLVDDQACDDHHFPGPRSDAAASGAHDITFALHEGDFQEFRGVWRMQQTANAGDELLNTRLSYALFVRPQRWLPVQLVQSRIEGEVVANLIAVRAHAEKCTLASIPRT